MGRGRHVSGVSSRPGLSRGKLRTSVMLGAMLGVLAFAVVAIASHGSSFINLTTLDATVSHNGAVFIQGGVGAGTGNYDPFLQVQETGSGDGIQMGYNTEPASNGEFDTKGINPGNTHKLLVSAVPVQILNGIEYREFSLDSNDTGSDSYMSIDEIKIFIDTQFALTGYDRFSESFSNDTGPVATKVWDLDGDGNQTILANTQSLEPGSGVSDITVLVPSSVFPEECYYGSETCDKYLIFWTVNGEYTENDDGRDYDADSGFEEWRVRLLPVVNVTKTANESFTRDYSWEILKTADPTSANLFAGESQTFDYDVTVTQTVTDGAFAVSGTVTISNPTGGAVIEQDIDAEITGYSDSMTGVGDVPLTCPGVTLPYTLGPGESIECTYSVVGNPAFSATYTGTNTATVTILNDVDAPTQYSGSAAVDFTDVTPSVTGYPTINVTDTVQGVLGSASATYTFEYSQQQTCSTNPNAYTSGFYDFDVDNVASIDETGQVDDETITVNCYAPVVSKDAAGRYDIDHTWTIDKVDDGVYKGFAGESVTHPYTVSVVLTETPGNYSVTGSIYVTNPAGSPGAMTVGLTDALNDAGATGAVISGCTDGTWDATAETVTVAAGATATCSYSASPANDSADTNTVTATLGTFETMATDPIEWSSSDTGNPTINVTDTNGESWQASASDSWDYTKDFSCPTDPTMYTSGVYTMTQDVNTAEITETGQQATASVDLTCYAPVVSKDAATKLTRTYDWNIEKTGDQSSLILSIGQTFMVNYDVTVTATYTDSDWMAYGTISVANPNPDAPMTVDVSDEISDGISAAVDCDAATPGDQTSLTVIAGGSGTCSYEASLPDASDRTNTATATLNQIDFTGTANVSFADPEIEEIDECITVTDDKGGALGTVCYNELPKTFEYSLFIGPYEACGTYEYVNTASFESNDGGDSGQSSWTVDVLIPCEGCTLTQGYWKTHSENGPAPYDETWALLANGADTSFYLSGQSWYEVFWTAPQGGNAYYQLAHQFMAAQLNLLDGASSTAAVDAALAAADAWFQVTTPAQAADLKGKAAKDVRAWASTLASYNEGLIGPGHCDEDGFSLLSAWPMILLSLGAAAVYTGRRRGRYEREEKLIH